MLKEKEEQLCKKRFLELANTAYYKGYATYSDFLNLNEQSLFYQMDKEIPNVSYFLWGGTELAERKILCFATEKIEKELFPLCAIKITPSNIKFAEKLTHRDYLGAILNLGIDRSKIGDIMPNGSEAYVFLHMDMKEYILSQLEKVKHTKVICKEVEQNFSFEQQYKMIHGNVSSVRLDAVIALAFGESRSSLIGMISGGKVFVNGAMVSSNSYTLCPGDIVSVRGKGKFVYQDEECVTKKGKIKIVLRKYV